tara:strand:- start:1395 stop:1982 length:588 start_codon:yes stop_codon:yes gene_type:complete
MEVKAEKKIKFYQEKSLIWNKMIDPSFIVKSVPGAELTEQTDERHFKGKISIKIGPVTAKFNGEAEFTLLDESNNELTMEGKGLDASGKGSANITMNIKLLPLEGGGTEMQSSMKLSITGKLAQFGSRMIVAVNNKMFDQWSNNFIDLLNDKLEKNMKKNDSTTKINKYKDTDSQPIKAFTFLWSSLKNIFSKNS